MSESPVLPTIPAERRGYRECPRCQHRIPWSQPIPMFFSLPADCPECGNEVQKQKTEEQRRAEWAILNAVEPQAKAWGLLCPHCRHRILTAFKPNGVDLVILECDNSYSDEPGCAYRYQTDNAGHAALLARVEVAWRQDFIGNIDRMLDRMEKEMCRAGVPGSIQYRVGGREKTRTWHG